MIAISKIGHFLFIFLLAAKVALAQLDRATIAQLPDSLRPLNPDKISFREGERILLNSRYEDIPLERYRADLDRFSVDFARRYRTFRSKKEQLRHCRALQVYWASRVTTDQRLVAVFLDSAKKYNTRYRTIIGKDSSRYAIEFANYYRQKAFMLYVDGKFSESYNQYLNAANLFKQLGANRELSSVYRIIGEIRMQLQEFEEALSAVDSGLVALGQSRRPNEADAEYLRFGQVLSFKRAELYGFLFCTSGRKEDYDSTMKAIDRYWQVPGQEIYNRRNKYLTLMRVSYFARDYRSSIAYADSFLSHRTKDYPDVVWATCNVYKALSYDKIGKVFENGTWLSIRWVEPDNPDYRLLLRELYLTEEKRGNFKKALQYQGRLMEFRDSLGIINHSRKILVQQREYDNKLAEMKINALRERETRNSIYFGLLMLIVVLLIIIAVMERIYRMRKMKVLVSRIEELTLLHITRIEDEKQNERKRLGQELHDNLGGIIAASVRLSKALGEDSDDMRVKTGLSDLCKMLEDGYHRARSQSHELYNDTTTENYWKDVAKDIELFFFGSKISVEFQNFASNVALSAEVKTILLITLREAITNTIKHAGATLVRILAYEDQEKIILEISDNGRGFVNAVASVGIRSIRDRIERSSGSLTIKSNTSSGTCIRASLRIEPFSDQEFANR